MKNNVGNVNLWIATLSVGGQTEGGGNSSDIASFLLLLVRFSSQHKIDSYLRQLY